MKVEENFKQLNIRQIQTKANSNVVVKNTPTYNQPSFTGVPDMVLRFLDTNPAWGADAVDLCFMVTPRTLTDFGRGKDAGIETMRREGMGTANHSSVPLYGALAGMAVAAGLNRMYFDSNSNIKANKIYADSETLDMMGKLYKAEVDAAKANPEAKPLREFLVKYFKNYEALSPTENGKYIKIPAQEAESVADLLTSEIEKAPVKPAKDVIETAKARIISSLGGVENNFRIIAEEGAHQHTSRYTVDTIVDNAYKLGSAFTKDKVLETFTNMAEGTENAFIKAMKSMNVKRSLIGLGIASAIGVSAQPFNMYLTKKKTGNSGFVGGGEEDKSNAFKAKKAAVAGIFGAGVLSTIMNPKNFFKNPKSLIQALQFKGFNPTINQFKFIYGVTIMSRFLSARNGNELSEASIKDTLGFASWLILGNFVQKLVAQALDKDLIKKDGEGVMKWITGSVLKSRDEVLHAALGKKAFKDGKALPYNELTKLADKATKVKLRKLSIAQIVNYAYTGLVLGVGIPKLNIYLTGRREAKKAALAAKNNNSVQQVQNSNISSTGALKGDNMLNPANRQFLNNASSSILG